MTTNKNKIAEILPLTPMQSGMLFHALAKDSTNEDPYILQIWGTIFGQFTFDQFAQAWKILIERHVTFRTAFVTQADKSPRQVILREIPFAIQKMDWGNDDLKVQTAKLLELRKNDKKIPFDLLKPPLLRVSLIKTGHHAWSFLFTIHHLILDGWSQAIVVSELKEILGALILGQSAELSEPVGPQIILHQLPKFDASEDAFWIDQLQNWQSSPLPDVAPSRQESVYSAHRGSTVLAPTLTSNLIELSKIHRLPQSIYAFAAWACVLCRWTGKLDVTFGMTVSGRSGSEDSFKAVGMFVNTLPLRINVQADQDFMVLMENIHQLVRAIDTKEQTDLVQLQKLAAADHHNPLFDTLVAFENFPSDTASDSVLTFDNLQTDERTNLSAALVIVPGDSWTVSLQCDGNKVNEHFSQQLLADFTQVLQQMLREPKQKIGSFLAKEAHPMREVYEPRSSIDAMGNPLVDKFIQIAKLYPLHTAVKFEKTQLSYQQLLHQVLIVADNLTQLGVKAGDTVVLSIHRNAELPALMLGVLYIGALYVPLDPTHPIARRQLILADCKPHVIIQNFIEILHIPTATPDALLTGKPTQFPPHAIGAHSPAYIIYTSGSTGQPKGVLVPHSNVLHLLEACQEPINTGPDDIWTMFHSFAFDFSVWELFGPLLSGGCCLIVTHEMSRDSIAFVELCDQENVTVLSQTPSAFALFMEAEKMRGIRLSSLRQVIFGGEALILAKLKAWFEYYPDTQPTLTNMYGITETTVHVTWRHITSNDVLSQPGSLIGVPLKHLKIELLGEHGLPVPDGIAGEIHVSGTGVAIGYLNKPEETASRFLPHSSNLQPGSRKYKSGDLARKTLNGELEYLGRIDDQVKIRGFRIELGEIEHALAMDDEVKFAAVGTWSNTDHQHEENLQLCAWIVAKVNYCDLDKLKLRLKQRLPHYMIPEQILLVPAIPLTSNGKIDRKALPNPKDVVQASRNDSLSHDTTLISKATELETAICEIWAEVLGLSRVYPNENYFSLGGDSIRSLSIASLAAKRGIIFEIRRLFDHPTPQQLAAWIEQSRKNVAGLTSSGTSNTAEKSQQYVHFELLDEHERKSLPKHIIDAWPATKIQCGMIFHSEYGDENNYYIDTWLYKLKLPVDQVIFTSALSSLYKIHPILRSSFSLDSARPLQLIHEHVPANITWIDLRSESDLVSRETVKHDLAVLRQHKFVFEQPGLAKFVIHQTADDVINFTVCTHHAIIDGWSISLLTSELIKLYFALLDKQTINTASAPALQSQIAKMEIEILNDASARQRWISRLTQFKSYELPVWQGMSSKGGLKRITIHKNVGDRLKSIAQESQVPLKAWIFSAFSYLLSWSSGKNYSSVGLVVNGRPESEQSKDALGLFLNTIPVGLNANGTWLEMAKAAFLAEADIYNDRLMPLSEIQKMNGGVRPFEANFNYVHFRLFSKILDENKFKLIEAVDLSWLTEIPLTANVSINPHSDEIEISLLYGPRYSEVQIQWMAGRFVDILEVMSAKPNDLPAIQDPILSHHSFNSLASRDSIEQAIHTTITQKLLADLQKVAVIDRDCQPYTAETILVKTARLVESLRHSGALPGMAIAIYLPRSLHHVIAQLAALNMGAWFVSLDPNMNAERNVEVLKQLGEFVLIKESTYAVNDFVGMSIAAIDIDLMTTSHIMSGAMAAEGLLTGKVSNLKNTTAYAIFTSGSTGSPKGVLISHHSIASHMQWMNAEFKFGASETVIHRTNPIFDASLWEIWSPLMTGATLVIASDAATKDPSAIAQLIESTNATVLQLVPSILETMLDASSLKSLGKLHRLFIGGEALRTELIRSVCDVISVEMINLYGPSETTIQCTYEVINRHDVSPFLAQIPIGKPISGAIAIVVNEAMQEVPTGVIGELIIGGNCPALGYLNLPELTKERFIHYPQSEPKSVFFKTGDLVSRLADGKLLFHNRLDRQIKIGGNRIELAEIENHLSQIFPKLRIAVEAEHLKTYSRLVAYIAQFDEGSLDTNHIRQQLGIKLPAYMIPSIFRNITVWPTLPSGKTDRNALILLGQDFIDTKPVLQPSDLTLDGFTVKQQKLLVIVGTLIETSVGIDDDLFTLGMDSISAMQLVARARKESIELTPRDIFKYRTIRAIGSISQLSSPTYQEPPVGSFPLLPAQKWFLTLNMPRPDWWNQVVSLKLRQRIPVIELIAALKILGSRHRSLSMRIRQGPFAQQSFDGHGSPYILIEESVITSSTDHLKQAVKTVQEHLNLASGPIWGVVIERDTNLHAMNLMIAIHHIATDGVSWRIIFDELNTLLHQHELPPQGPSSASVALHLASQLANEQDLEHWRKFSRKAHLLQQTSSETTIADSMMGAIIFTPAQTLQFLQKTTENWSSPIEVLLITALSNALAEFFQDEMTLAIERHGRDIEFGPSLDQTLGWFTQLYPFIFQPNNDPIQTIQEIKKSLLELPKTDWFTAISIDPTIAHKVSPSIIVNWLGRFDSSFASNSIFEPLGIDVGFTIHPLNPRTSQLELTGLIDQGELRISLSADPHFLNQQQFDIFVAKITSSITKLIEAPINIAHASWTPTDIPWLENVNPQQFSQFLESAGNFEKILPTTPVQQGLAYRNDLEGPSSGKYIQQIEFDITGNLDSHLIANAFDRVGLLHEALRTGIIQSENGTYVQVIYPQALMQHLVFDFSNDDQPISQWDAMCLQDRETGFQIHVAPLSRTTLVKVGTSQWKLLWTHHHVILDGWSVPIIIHDLSKLISGLEVSPPASRSSFWAWLCHQRNTSTDSLRSTLWRQRFSKMESPCLIEQLPTHQIQLRQEPYTTSEVLNQEISQELSTLITRFLRRNGITFAALINAAWAYTLANILDREDSVHGVAISGRPTELQGSERWVGMFINTLPLYVDCSGHQSIQSWLKEIQQNLAELNTAPQDSLADIQLWVNQSKALFDSIVVFQNYPMEKNISGNNHSLVIKAGNTTEKNEYPLSLYVEDRETIVLTLRFDKSKISSAVARTISDALVVAMDYWSRNEHNAICSTNLMAPDTQLKHLKWGSGSKQLGLTPPADNIYQQSIINPHHIALHEEVSATSINYADLVANALKISAQIKKLHLNSDARICVLGNHCISTVTAMLGALYAGQPFVPLDPHLPTARLKTMIDETSPALFLVEKSCLNHPLLAMHSPVSIESLCAQERALASPSEEVMQPRSALAYILFTSGSTGKPKGVQIPTTAFTNAISHFVKTPGIQEQDRLASVTTISFDIALLEIFGPLSVGACVHLISRDTAKDGINLKNYLVKQSIHILQATPSTWKSLQAVQAQLPHLRAWCGGEALPKDLANWMQQACLEVWNLYGPTETTIWSSTYQVDTSQITAGKPISNTEMMILNKNHDLALPEGIGELCISGAGVARGYLHQPSLTAASFIPHPFAHGETLYRTGDQAFWSSDGNIVILGRIDKQIKMNGFRIELGDIESTIRNLPGIRDAVVLVVNQHATPILVAWVVASDHDMVTEKIIIDHLISQLPSYMIPQHVNFIDEIPLTANNKININALLLPENIISPSKRKANNPLEMVILSIISNALTAPQMGPDDHFMQYGGNSLTATVIRGRLERLFKMSLSLNNIFALGSAAKIMALILENEKLIGSSLETAQALLKLSAAKRAQKTSSQKTS